MLRVHLASNSRDYKINQTKWAQKARHIANSSSETVFKEILFSKVFISLNSLCGL